MAGSQVRLSQEPLSQEPLSLEWSAPVDQAADTGGGRAPADGWLASVAEHKRRTRARILAAAAELVAEHGASGLVMSALARRSGVARATLYNYFPDVEQVLEALVAVQVGEFLADLERCVHGVPDAGDRLRLAIGTLVAWTGGQAARRPARPRRGGPPSRAVVGRIHRPLGELRDRVALLVAAARDAGSLPADTDPVLATRFVVAVVLGTREELGSSRNPEVARRLHDFILGGLGLTGGA
jgi:AcrR family transcriptional regulator